MNSSLTPGQKALLRGLVALGGFLAANSLYLHFSPPRGMVLPGFYQGMLLAHVWGGILLLVPMTIFILWHFTVVLRKRHPFAVWTGVGIAAAAVLLMVTGLFLRENANTEANRVWFVTHWVLGLGIPLAYVLHRISAEQKPTARSLLGGAGVVVAGALAMAGIHHGTKGDAPPPLPEFQRTGYAVADGKDPFLPFDPKSLVAEAQADSVFFPSPTRTANGSFTPNTSVTNGELPDYATLKAEIDAKGFSSDHPIGADMCARCHPDVVAQWKSSAHRFSSFNNPFYRSSVMDMREEEDGFLKSKWCAGCHDPAVLFPGKMAKEFDLDLPDAQAGLTCLACHSIESVHSVGGNGGYTFADQTETPYLFSGVKGGPGEAMHDLLVRSKPEVHKRSMKKPLMETSEFCAACHKVSLQFPVNDYRWFRGQNDYDSWHNSGIARNNPQTFYLPPKVRECQDCHMPKEPAVLGDVSAKDGMIRSHRFPGINTALPSVRGDEEMVKYTEEFLKKGTMRVDLFVLGEDGVPVGPLEVTGAPLAPGKEVDLLVVVRNLGVGHIFPAGTLDSNEGWIAVEVTDAAGKSILRSGWLEEDRSLSKEAHTYGATIIDRHSKRIDRRNAKDIYVPAQVNVVPPGAADVARYRIKVPEDAAGSLFIRATLRFRKFKADYTAFSFKGREVPVLPVTDIASAEASSSLYYYHGDIGPTGPVKGTGKVKGTGVSASPPPDWTRWNDLGIAAWRQNDTRLAALAFAEVDKFQPDLPDGHRNLARVAIAEGRYEDSLVLLEAAEKRAPGDARTAYWFGTALSKFGKYDPALEAFERVLRDFPEDRNSLREIAEIFFRTGNPEESLKWWLKVLAIDPEDFNAHEHRAKCYQQMGMEAEAAEAAKSFLRYKGDEDAPQKTNAYLRANPDVNHEVQPVHVHELHPAR